jgi:dTDP-4-dehydrorhamnose reductase
MTSPRSGLAMPPRLRPITTAQYPTPARRPANSRLDCSRIESAYGIVRPAWQASLDVMLAELSASTTEMGN